MTRARMKKLAALPAVGAVATGATAATTWTPAAAPAPLDAHRAAPLPQQADPGGTYESCAAYFGLGKEVGVLDVVAFTVSDGNGSDGVAHGVPADTQVVIVLTDDTGATIECTPVEITEEAWADAMDQVGIPLPEGASYPAWPGPGHYAYPTVSYDPVVEGFGTVVATEFRVTSIPDGHTLVSPSGVEPLVQHFPFDPWSDGFFAADQRVVDFVAAGTGPAAAAAFAAIINGCHEGPDPVITADGAAAINHIRAYRGFEPQDLVDMGCYSIDPAYAETSVLLGLDATVAYVEPIVLALPDSETTTTTSTTTQPSSPGATPARPIAADARFTG